MRCTHTYRRVACSDPLHDAPCRYTRAGAPCSARHRERASTEFGAIQEDGTPERLVRLPALGELDDDAAEDDE
jgi:hypothetical protein